MQGLTDANPLVAPGLATPHFAGSWSLIVAPGMAWSYLAFGPPNWVLCLGDAVIPLALAGINFGLLVLKRD